MLSYLGEKVYGLSARFHFDPSSTERKKSEAEIVAQASKREQPSVKCAPEKAINISEI